MSDYKINNCFPFDNFSDEKSDLMSGEEVVISGISGKFPASENVVQFMDNIYQKVNMVSKSNNACGPGKIEGVSKFDASFFRVPYKQAMVLDPINRLLLEHTYGAIYDAGINPVTLQGRKIGVFIGCGYYDNCFAVYDISRENIYAITGNGSKSMYANRISYWIDSKGPSFNIDSTCSSSMVCLDMAFRSIKAGECESAIVGAANLCLHPNLTNNIERAGLCSTNEDTNAETHRSEAINVIFLQKAKDAKRIYAEVYSSQLKYGLTPESEFLPVRNVSDTQRFLEEFYSKINVSPDEVEYLETHGPVDINTEELEAVAKVFSKKKPIKIGSVKAFMGNSEAASGLCAVTKICLAYHEGKIIADYCPGQFKHRDNTTKNMHFRQIQEEKCFDRGFAAINNFSFGGLDAHILLKSHFKTKKIAANKPDLPSLVLVSGRNIACVNKMFGVLKSEPLDSERIALLHDIHNTDIPGHAYRGYIILEAENKANTILSQGINLYGGNSRPLCFVYSGMGSQWPGMGCALMRLPIFRAAIERCKKVLDPKGVDIIEILTKPDKKIFENILNSFVGIAAVQIGLTDILNHLGIFPDFIIGHSVGELGCGYADGCLTAEEMILAAYSRGLVSIQTPFIHGSMAAVGLGYRAVQHLCPPEIEVACHNSTTSSTISGPSDIIQKFACDLKSRGIFVKEVPCSNIAYHSKYIKHAGLALLERLREVIVSPKLRSKKWICSSLPPEKSEEALAEYCSAEYHVNNLLNPVYFQEAAKSIPSDAVIIEIAPHNLLQAILKRSHPDCLHLSLTKRWQSNPVKFLLDSIGKLYEEGFNPKIDVLYPKIEYPVSSDTLFLSHLIDWAHSEDWPNIVIKDKEEIVTSARDIVFSVYDDEYKFINGFVRNGKNVLPEAAILFFIWESFALFKCVKYSDLSVVFKDVCFFTEVCLTSRKPRKLSLMINMDTNLFEMSCDDIKVTNGYIAVISKPCEESDPPKTPNEKHNSLLYVEDIYKIFYYRGLQVKNEFKSIHSVNHKDGDALVKWTENWITFIDSLIQLFTIKQNYKGVSVPKFISEFIIDTELQKISSQILVDDVICYAARISGHNLIARSAGVFMKYVIFEDVPLNEPHADVIEEIVYVKHFGDYVDDMSTCIRVMLQIVASNVADTEVQILNTVSNSRSDLLGIKEIAENMAQNDFNFHFIKDKDIQNAEKLDQIHLMIVSDLFDNKKRLKVIEDKVNKNTFILTSEHNEVNACFKSFEVISKMKLSCQTLFLLRRKQMLEQNNTVYLNVRDKDTFSWIPKVQMETSKSNQVVLISERNPLCGLLGVVKQLNKTSNKKIRLFIVDDYHAPAFSPANKRFKEQLQKNLFINVFKQGKWGGFYTLPISKLPVINKVMLTYFKLGDAYNLKWVESHVDLPTSRTIQVYYAGISAHDFLKASGESKAEHYNFGMDFSGIDERGNKVMGLIESGSMASVIEADKALLWPVPKYWTLKEAATVPLPYVNAYYCLMIKGQLQNKQTVFVNSGFGAMGQAVISICLTLNCTVFTTVSDNDEKRFLLKLFPQLKANNIDVSKDGDFYCMVLKNTNQKGCDFVVNSATGVCRQGAMKCVGSIGIFMDINDVDHTIDNDFGMFFLDESRSYINVQVASLFKPENINDRKFLQQAFAEGIANGTIRPQTQIEYSSVDICRAFKLVSSRPHRGRMLIKMKKSSLNCTSVIPRVSHDSNGVYIVIDDDSQLGIDLADYLVGQGVRKIILHKKLKQNTGYLNAKLQSWKKFGVKMKVIPSKLSTEEDCKNIIKEGTILGVIKGIFVVQNTSFKCRKHLDQHEFSKKFKQTASVVAYMDLLSRSYCTKLSYFVVLTRSTNNISDEYVASVCEKICESRKDVGLPALSFKAHLIDEFSCSNYEDKKLGPQSIQTVFKTMDQSLRLESGNVHTFNIKQTRSRCHDKYETIDCGFQTFYKFIARDEVMANEPVVRMRTLLGCESEDDFSKLNTESCLMLIPGFEGHHEIFNSFSLMLKCKAIALQLQPDLLGESIAEMALSVRKSMAKCHIQPKSKFYLLGHSFGVNVALELAAILEKEGLRGIVFCLDSSPDILRIRLNTYLGTQPDKLLEDIILENIYKIIAGENADGLQDKLSRLGKWSSKVEAWVSVLKGKGFSIEYTREVINAAYNRIKSALNYDTNIKLESKLVLVKGKSVSISTSAFADEYNLSRFSAQTVEVISIESDSVSASLDSEIPNIVNRYLGGDV